MTVFWQEPKITVMGRSMVQIGSDSTGWKTNDVRPITDCEELPEIGGRVCYMSFAKGRKSNQEYIANILDKGHESVLEHAVVSFGIEGISRSCSHEFIRHRHLSFSQLSQRYVKDIAFVVPIGMVFGTTGYGIFKGSCETARMEYNHLLEVYEDLDAKTANALARSVLPNATETKMLVTGNLRAWRHFVKLRGTEHAEAEIRRLACGILDELKQLAPNVFQDLEVVDGTVRTIPTK